MNEMNDIRDMSHSKSERKQKRPILKLFINKFSPISLKMDKFPPLQKEARMLNLLHPWSVLDLYVGSRPEVSSTV